MTISTNMERQQQQEQPHPIILHQCWCSFSSRPLSAGWGVPFHVHGRPGLADRQHSKYAWGCRDPPAIGCFHRQPLRHCRLSAGQPHLLPHHPGGRHHRHSHCQALQDAGLQLHSGESFTFTPYSTCFTSCRWDRVSHLHLTVHVSLHSSETRV